MSDKLKCPHCGSEAERAEKFQGYCFDCWNYDVPELRQQLAAITQERDAALKKADTLQKILSDSLELEKQYSEGYGQLQKERDALRDVVQEIDDTVESIFDDGGLVVTHYKIPAYVISKALSLLTHSGEAGKGGGS